MENVKLLDLADIGISVLNTFAFLYLILKLLPDKIIPAITDFTGAFRELNDHLKQVIGSQTIDIKEIKEGINKLNTAVAVLTYQKNKD